MDIKYYRKMKNIERLSGTFKFRPYNLLEHSYMVLVLFRHFASKEDVSYDMNTLDFVIHHDGLESISTDLIWPVKNFSKITKDCWKKIEEEIVKKHHQLERYSDHNIKENLTPIQYSLFKACDMLDLWIFLKEEWAIGNHSKKIEEALENCVNLVPKEFKHIQKFMEEYED
jgi:5'-deoxynucleotidase YfbR-like HD superfamily hydrolase